MQIKIKKTKLCKLMKEMYNENILTDIGGNISFKDEKHGTFWISPSRIRKNTVTPKQLVEVSLETGEVLTNTEHLRPSVEWPMHLTIYQQHPATNMILHTHAPYATAYSILEDPPEIPPLTLELSILVPKIVVVPYKPSGTKELGTAVSTYLNTSEIVILKNHGTVAITETDEFVDTAVKTRALEEYLRLFSLAKQLGTNITPYPGTGSY